MPEATLNNNQENEDATVFTLTQDQIDQLREEAQDRAKSAKHQWKQNGVWVRCVSCEHEHAFFVGVGKKLVGVDDNGNPIIVDF